MSESQLEIKKDPYEQAKKYLNDILEDIVNGIFQKIDKINWIFGWDEMVNPGIEAFVNFFTVVVRKSEFLENELAREKIELLTEEMRMRNKDKVKQLLHDMDNLLRRAVERHPV